MNIGQNYVHSWDHKWKICSYLDIPTSWKINENFELLFSVILFELIDIEEGLKST